jgi:hypothetical protein
VSSGPSVPRSQRKSPKREFTLAPEAAAITDAMPRGKRSAYVSDLILDDALAQNRTKAQDESRKHLETQGKEG